MQVSIFKEIYPLKKMKVLLRRVQFLTLCYKTLTIKIRFCFYSSTNLSHNSSLLFFSCFAFKECLLLLIDLWSQETRMPPTGLIPKVAGFASLPHIKAPPCTGYANIHCVKIPAALHQELYGPT